MRDDGVAFMRGLLIGLVLSILVVFISGIGTRLLCRVFMLGWGLV